jgi:hypothetical protein
MQWMNLEAGRREESGMQEITKPRCIGRLLAKAFGAPRAIIQQNLEAGETFDPAESFDIGSRSVSAAFLERATRPDRHYENEGKLDLSLGTP